MPSSSVGMQASMSSPSPPLMLPTDSKRHKTSEMALEYPLPLFLPIERSHTGRSLLPDQHSDLVGAYIIGNHMKWNDFESVVALCTERVARMIYGSVDKSKLAAVGCDRNGHELAAAENVDVNVDHFMDSYLEPAMDVLHTLQSRRPSFFTGGVVVTPVASSTPGRTKRDTLTKQLRARGIEYKEPDIVICNGSRIPRAVGMIKPCAAEDLELERKAYLAGQLYGKFTSLLGKSSSVLVVHPFLVALGFPREYLID